MQHVLKTDSDVFDASWNGHKPWEIRFNDRQFKPQETYCLAETVYTGQEMLNGAPLEYTGRKIKGIIDYIMEGDRYGLDQGWVILSCKHVTQENTPVIIPVE